MDPISDVRDVADPISDIRDVLAEETKNTEFRERLLRVCEQAMRTLGDIPFRMNVEMIGGSLREYLSRIEVTYSPITYMAGRTETVIHPTLFVELASIPGQRWNIVSLRGLSPIGWKLKDALALTVARAFARCGLDPAIIKPLEANSANPCQHLRVIVALEHVIAKDLHRAVLDNHLNDGDRVVAYLRFKEF